MQLHQIKIKKNSQKKKRVGRGGKRGTYSGKGVKGQNSRAGRRLQPIIREVIKRHPKLKGYRQKTKQENIEIINLDVLEKNFQKGDLINPNVLVDKKVIDKKKGRVPAVKILSKGEISKEIIVESCKVSEKAKEKIEKAGGKIK